MEAEAGGGRDLPEVAVFVHKRSEEVKQIKPFGLVTKAYDKPEPGAAFP